jgi:nondiscriminating aspartyl-tRNA synthetase
METIEAHPPLVRWSDDADVVVLRAMVLRVRELKRISFLHLRTPTELIQAVWSGPLPDGVRPHAAVEVTGRPTPARIQDPSVTRRTVELQLTALEVLSSPGVAAAVDVTKPVLEASAETVLDERALTLRHPAVRAAFVIQAALVRGFRQYLDGQGFTELRTPKLGAQGAEGGANTFELDYFGQRATLAQSPQFYKELGTGAFLRVYEVGPVFRAEKHATSRHLNEYTSLDLELGPLRSFTEVMAMETGLLRHMLAHVSETCGAELSLLGVGVPGVPAIPALTFAQAKARVGGDDSPDLSPAEEAALGASVKAETGSDWVFVTHYPSSKRPFYALDTPADPSVTESFDLLFRGVEITTGGQRIHEHAMLIDKLVARGLDPEGFAFFHHAHAMGLPPHGGLGLGLERLTQQLLGLSNVREATLFPRDRHRLVP